MGTVHELVRKRKINEMVDGLFADPPPDPSSFLFGSKVDDPPAQITVESIRKAFDRGYLPRDSAWVVKNPTRTPMLDATGFVIPNAGQVNRILGR